MAGSKNPKLDLMTGSLADEFSLAEFNRVKKELAEHSKTGASAGITQRQLSELSLTVEAKNTPPEIRREYAEILLKHLSNTNNEVFDKASLLIASAYQMGHVDGRAVTLMKKCLSPHSEKEMGLTYVDSGDGHVPVPRASAARALAMMGAKAAIEDIKTLFHDSNEMVRRFASNAVKELEEIIKRTH